MDLPTTFYSREAPTALLPHLSDGTLKRELISCTSAIFFMFKFAFRSFSLASLFAVIFSFRAHAYCREAISYFYLDRRPFLLKYLYHILTLVSPYSPKEEKLFAQIIESIDGSAKRNEILADGVADLSPLPSHFDLDRATDSLISGRPHCEDASRIVKYFYEQCIIFAADIYRAPTITALSFVKTIPGALSQSGLWHHDGIGSRLTFWCILQGGDNAPYLQYLKGSHLVARKPFSGFNTRYTSKTALKWSSDYPLLSLYAAERRIYVLDTNGIHRGVYAGCSTPRMALMLTISDQAKSESLSKFSPMLAPLDVNINDACLYLS